MVRARSLTASVHLTAPPRFSFRPFFYAPSSCLSSILFLHTFPPHHSCTLLLHTSISLLLHTSISLSSSAPHLHASLSDLVSRRLSTPAVRFAISLRAEFVAIATGSAHRVSIPTHWCADLGIGAAASDLQGCHCTWDTLSEQTRKMRVAGNHVVERVFRFGCGGVGQVKCETGVAATWKYVAREE